MGNEHSIVEESKYVSKDAKKSSSQSSGSNSSGNNNNNNDDNNKYHDAWSLQQVPRHFPSLLNDEDIITGKRGLRILSLDGGGLRGHIELVILNQIELLTGKRIYELFDLICGTSTGGLIVLGCVNLNLSMAQLGQMYYHLGSRIFNVHSSSVKSSNFASRGTFYDASVLQRIVQEKGGDVKMADCSKPKVFVVAAADNNQPYLLRNYTYKNPVYLGSSEATVTQAARATSAAPLYFTPEIIDGVNLVDGGVVANNPVLIAVDEAQRLWPEAFCNGASAPRIDCIVSVGTGKKVPKGAFGTSLFDVLKRLKGLIADSKTAADEAKRKHHHSSVSDRYYFRFNPPGLGDIALDNSDQNVIDHLRETTLDYVARKRRKFEQLKLKLTA